jgi:hypothetical protein
VQTQTGINATAAASVVSICSAVMFDRIRVQPPMNSGVWEIADRVVRKEGMSGRICTIFEGLHVKFHLHAEK